MPKMISSNVTAMLLNCARKRTEPAMQCKASSKRPICRDYPPMRIPWREPNLCIRILLLRLR